MIGIRHMELNVRLFALYRERAGQNIIKVAVEDGATVADLTAEVRRMVWGAIAVRLGYAIELLLF